MYPTNTSEQLPADTKACLINPAMMPAWFWDQTGAFLAELSVEYAIPEVIRNDVTATIEDNIQIIDDSMQGSEHQFLVVLSRGIELGVRYIDRLHKRDDVGRLLGWMVMSSVGPRGSEVLDTKTLLPLQRHTEQYSSGIIVDNNGLELLTESAARQTLLSDIQDEQLIKKILADMVHDRPLTAKEVQNAPDIAGLPRLPLSWYIGELDQVDNTLLSASVAREKFNITPAFQKWGHIAPITHPKEVALLIVHDLMIAHKLRLNSHG